MQLDVVEAVQDGVENASAMWAELPRTEAAATAASENKPHPEESGAPGGAEASAKAQPRKRGRPEKAEGESWAERKAPAAGEKTQKSLFDFRRR